MTESNEEFIARMRAAHAVSDAPIMYSKSNIERLIALAEERVMIEERRLAIGRTETQWECYEIHAETESSYDTDLSTAIRSVVAKIGEGNG